MPEEDEEREENLTVPVRVNLLPSEYAQLMRLREEHDRSIAWLVRRAVRSYLLEMQEMQT